MPELSATLKAMYKVESRKNKFQAQLQGIDLDDTSTSDSDSKPSTLQDVQARALARLNKSESVKGAAELGLTPDMGVGYTFLGSGN